MTRFLLGATLVAVLSAVAPPAQAQRVDCNADAARIRKAESELPRLEVAPPADRQIVCITLETNILFARRLAAHVKQCPRSPHARGAETWERTGSSYAAQFRERGCKPTIRN